MLCRDFYLILERILITVSKYNITHKSNMHIQKPETIRGEIHTLKIHNVSRISELGCLTDEYARYILSWGH